MLAPVLDVLRSGFRFAAPEIPERLIVKPIDPWPGSAAEGLAICDESHDIRAGHLQDWPQRLHRFFWLRDLRTMGGAEARSCAKDMMVQWIYFYGGKPKTAEQKLAWRTDILGERIANWISHYDFIEACQGQHDEAFNEAFFAALYEQAQHLFKRVPGGVHDLPLLKALKGLLYAGLAFEGHEAWIEKALDGLRPEMGKQILADGTHVSRSPMQLLRAMQILLDIKAALSAGDYPLPEEIQYAIDRAGLALKFFRMVDKRLVTMHGSQKGDAALMDSVLAQAGVRAKSMQTLPYGGFEKMHVGRTSVMIDVGGPPPYPHDRVHHAAPLAFELSYGRDRVFVSCGTHPMDMGWAEALRATAAHNTVSLDNRNAYEIRGDGHFSRRAQSCHHTRQGNDDAVLIEASHDGYLPLNGFIHSRSLYLGDRGHDFRGEDVLHSRIKPMKPVEIAVRFHLHPKVVVSLAQDGCSALLRLPGGIGWRFHHDAGLLSLEDSVYMGEGLEIRKTQQLVIYGQTTEKKAKIKWAFQREGL